MQKILTLKNREVTQNAGRDTVLKEDGAKDCNQYLSTRGRNVAKETKTEVHASLRKYVRNTLIAHIILSYLHRYDAKSLPRFVILVSI